MSAEPNDAADNDSGLASSANEPEASNLGSHIFNIAMLAVGALALAWMIHRLGWDVVTGAVTSVGAWFAVVLALDVTAMCFDAAALQAFMRPEARMVSYLRVLGAQASGRAINVLTPTGALGEATKLTMLVGYAPRSRVLSSIVLLNLSQFYLSVLVMIIGTPIMFMLVDIPHPIKVTLAIGFAVILPIVIAIAVLVKRGAVATLVAIIRRLHLVSDERADRWKARLVEVDKHIRELQENRSHGTWKGILWVLASKATMWTSTLLVLATSGVDVSPALVIGILSVGVLIQWISQIVPMGLGLQDGGNYALFDLVGATGAHGIGVTLLNRARSLSVALLGLVAMAVMWAIDRVQLARMRRRLARMRASANASRQPLPTARVVP
jgi:hypothetical protein